MTILGIHCGSVTSGYETTGAGLFEHQPGPLVFTEALGDGLTHHWGGDYEPYTSKGFLPLIRLNYGYHPLGTIPPRSKYITGSTAIMNFVSASNPKGLYWIIGNEMNFTSVEAPDGVEILPSDYAEYFNLCYDGIKRADPTAKVLVGAVAPWNNEVKYAGNERGDWVTYLTDALLLIRAHDGVCIHAYTHGHDPRLIGSMQTMDAPFEDRMFEFLTYMDVALEIEDGVDLYITEANPAAGPLKAWEDIDNGWIEIATREADWWNVEGPTGGRLIKAICMYRYMFDSYEMANKPEVLKDFATAVNLALDWESEAPPNGGDMNLINRDGFESGFYYYNGIGELTCPGGWVPRWVPGTEDEVANGTLVRPEFKEAGEAQIRTGEGAVAIHSRYASIDGALVREFAVEPGTDVLAGVWLMNTEPAMGHGMQIGIDPFGGQAILSPDIVWSDWYSEHSDDYILWGSERPEDSWVHRSVGTVAGASTITVFLRSKVDEKPNGSHAHFDDFLLEGEAGTIPPPLPGDGLQANMLAQIDACEAALDGLRALVLGMDQLAVACIPIEKI